VALLLGLAFAWLLQPAECRFQLGFAALRERLPAVVGECLEDERHNPENGDTLQRTTGGLLVWRKADNWTAFTDGHRSWVNGPNGLQSRLNGERFAWEGSALHAAPLTVPRQFEAPHLRDRALNLPAGWRASVFASGVQGARMMVLGPDGDLFVSGTRANVVYRIRDRDHDGVGEAVERWATGLSLPHGLAVRDGHLYVAEGHRVVRLPLGGGPSEVVVPSLPAPASHVTRSLAFATGGELLVAAGSSCNVCIEDDARRGAVSVYAPGRIFARGLRNAVGLTRHPTTGEVWATTNGRDWLGDDMPADGVYRLRDGLDAGWPRCNPSPAGALVPDPDFGRPGGCDGVAAPDVPLPPHTAPLGLSFRGDELFVALHGSWNRSSPVGYKVVRMPFAGGRLGAPEDVVTGWLPPGGGQIWGRPVDVAVAPDGALLLSDDLNGTIYRISPRTPL
jgi:glucose/arabinose dehydrogenase